jgi:transposase
MGMQTAPAQLFYDFCLDDHVPEDHLLRRIDRFLDLEKVRTELKPFYSSIGRPSIDPELMMRMLIVGYCMGIRSERRLCDEIHLNLAYRWFCRLDLTAGCRTTPPSRATVMVGSGRATSCGICSRRWCSGACARVLLAAKASRWMRA